MYSLEEQWVIMFKTSVIERPYIIGKTLYNAASDVAAARMEERLRE